MWPDVTRIRTDERKNSTWNAEDERTDLGLTIELPMNSEKLIKLL